MTDHQDRPITSTPEETRAYSRGYGAGRRKAQSEQDMRASTDIAAYLRTRLEVAHAEAQELHGLFKAKEAFIRDLTDIIGTTND